MCILRFIPIAFLAVCELLATIPASAQTGSFPNRPLRLIIPFPAGGSSDILGRVFAEKMQLSLGQAVVVDNRAGGSTVIGTLAAATARPDGYTLLQVTPNAAIIGSLQPGLSYDLERDFTPVIGVGAVPLLLAVSPRSEIRSLADLTALARATPAGVTYASGGIGSMGHLAPARLIRDLKINATHIPFRGVAPALQEVAAGRVDFMLVSSLEGAQLAKAGQVRLLGVTAEQRLPSMPDVPTMAELGFPDFTPGVWYGFVVPTRTPTDVVDRLAKAIAEAAGDPSVKERLGGLGLSIRLRDGQDFRRYIHDEIARWSRVIKENNIRLE